MPHDASGGGPVPSGDAATAHAIREMQRGGASRTEIRRQLSAQGHDDAAARRLIDIALGTRGAAMARPGGARSGGGGGSGVLISIGIVILVNVLSYVFGWGWFFY